MPEHYSTGNRTISAPVLFAITLFAVVLLRPPAAWAHKVNVFAYVEGDTVVAECYFNDGRKCRDSTIQVFDNTGKKLLEGTTDVEGRFSFKAPVRTDLVIRLSASMGHGAEYTVPAAELPEGLPSAPEAATETSKSPSPKALPGARQTGPSEGLPTQGSPDLTGFEQAVDRAVARQLAPIRRVLEEHQRKQRLSDIVGGIGYIIGLMGLAMYFHSRQRRKQ